MAIDNEKTLRGFIGEWGKSFDEIAAAYRKYLTADAVWEQPGLPTTRSVEEAIGLLRNFKDRFDMASFGADVLHLLANERVAIAERIDHLRRSDGSLMASLPVTGVFEFNTQGKIAVWREYFDSASVMKAISAAAEARSKR